MNEGSWQANAITFPFTIMERSFVGMKFITNERESHGSKR